MWRFCCFIGVVLVFQASFSPTCKAVGNVYPEVQGVFGVAPVPENTAFAIWVPIESGAAISGISWYNNDSEVVFPKFLAMAGDYGGPGALALATVVGTNVSGVSSGWSTCEFSQPVTSENSGIYVIIELPDSSEFHYAGTGGGAGIGYIDGGDINIGWITGDGENWDPLAAVDQMAILPVVSQDKSANVLVLSISSEHGPNDDIHEEESGADGVEVRHQLSAVPNPFNPSTEVWFNTSNSGQVEVSVFDVRGRFIRRLTNSYLSAGSHHVRWDGRDSAGAAVASGVYFVCVRATNYFRNIRVTLVQ